MKTKNIPITEGISKLIIHSINVAAPIDTLFTFGNNPIKATATPNLTPISVIAIVGITEIINNIAMIFIREINLDTFLKVQRTDSLFMTCQI